MVDGECVLRFAWDSEDDPELCSLLLWRNLAGWPALRPYRSIGVEPMVGRVADLAHGELGDHARTDANGRFCWTLAMKAATLAHEDQSPV